MTTKKNSPLQVIRDEHITIPDTEVFLIPFGYDLDEVDSEIMEVVDERTLDFFKGHRQHLEKFIQTTSSVPMANWMKKQLERKCYLVAQVHDTSQDPPGMNAYALGLSGSFILFHDPGKDDPHAGAAISLRTRMYNADHYPPALLELLQFGCIHFNYYFAAPRFFELGENRVIKDYSLQNAFLAIEDPKIAVDELRLIWESESGTPVMYDSKGQVWCGSELYQSNLTVEQLLDSLFKAHLAKDYPDVWEIVEGKYL